MKQILIVEDEIIMNKILSNILLAEGYGVTSAHTAEKARRCFRSTVNDLAILDISLPNGSDYETFTYYTSSQSNLFLSYWHINTPFR